MTIRPVSPADNAALAQMIRAVFDEFDAPRQGTVYDDPTTGHLYEYFATPRSVLWVAEVGNEIIGSCGIFPTEGLPADCAELVKYYLPQTARGKGIGRELLVKCIESAKSLGYRAIYLESFSQFEKAVGIYEKLGFTSLNAPMGNSGHTACNIWMIKEL
jgi:putative acetyltransferase